MTFADAVEATGTMIDGIGVAVTAAGILIAAARYAFRAGDANGADDARYRSAHS